LVGERGRPVDVDAAVLTPLGLQSWSTVRVGGAMRYRRLLALAGSATILLAACGGTSREDELRSQVGDVLRGEFPVVDIGEVNCGDAIDFTPGSTFQCTAMVADGLIRTEVTMDEDGRARVVRLNALVDVDRAELEVAKDLTEGLGKPIKVDCGDQSFRVEEVGSTFECRAFAADNSEDSRGIEVTVDDLSGTIGWRLLDS